MIAMLEWIHLRSYDSPACLTAWNWNRRFTTHSLTHSVRHSQHRRLGLRFCLTSFAVVVVIKVFFFIFAYTLRFGFGFDFDLVFFLLASPSIIILYRAQWTRTPPESATGNWELGLGLGSGYCKSSPR